MGRNKEFDTVLVLHKAMEIFGEKGFEGTSLQDLLKHLGIARQSLYDTYGTKKDLFYLAVKHYVDEKNALVIKHLDNSPSVKEAIHEIFQEGINALQDPERAKMCYIINSAVEQMPHNEEIARYFHQKNQELETAFYQALVRAKNQNELKDHHKDLLSLARYLNQARLSLTFVAKLTPDLRSLQDVVRISLSIID
ncbi:TetR family transcriptional regulator [Priestia megaterium]|uniref:TetR/AcrR family transcriptional regulator n=1 Tax=Priestia megaterium TaxID=1404 RepID=UPI000BEBE2B6|nr:TetR/AcrR family transcriptional regulator [Priestia megaterium]MDP9580519.1 TetR/AcrR family transcriptional repressor of nem operon [Bacillus sp. 1751]MEB2278167.1 TetR/AcrR family transcriptional regulator [Bacillus sp. ILBB4]MDD1515751.1 TetR/AcrR family transcriptional regulator [Priestia megaterium]PEB60650.1 TetR family transcriptional regulator [Priestia megaterium]PFP40833.1 TetR family transcriptional regulator [Priestia megaterium]